MNNFNITLEQWQRAILRRKIGEILYGHRKGWLSDSEAKDHLMKVVDEYIEIVGRDAND